MITNYKKSCNVEWILCPVSLPLSDCSGSEMNRSSFSKVCNKRVAEV